MGALELFAGNAFPHVDEDGLELVNGTSLDAAMHVAPFADLGRSFYIIIGHVHAARVGNLSIDDHNLAMVAPEEVVGIGELHGVEFVELDALLAAKTYVFFLQGLIVRHVSEAVVKSPHLDTFLHLLGQQLEKRVGDGIVSEIEVFEMDGLAGIADGLEHIVEFLLARHQQGYGIVVRELDALFAEVVDDE